MMFVLDKVLQEMTIEESAIMAGKTTTRFPSPANSVASASLSDAVNCPTVFYAGIYDAGSSGTSQMTTKQRKRPSQYKRRVQATKNARSSAKPGEQGESEVTLLKRKVVEDETASQSKIAKRTDLEVVPREEPPTQL